MGRKVDVDDLIDSHAVAEMLSLSQPQSVSLYRKRYEDFPEPAVDMGAGRCLLWVRGDIAKWIKRRQ